MVKNPKPKMPKWYRRFWIWNHKMDKTISAKMPDARSLDRSIVNMLDDKVIQRRFEMLILTLLNALLAAVSIISLGYSEGWRKLIQFPLIGLWIYLLVVGFFAFEILWNRTKVETEEKETTDKKFDIMIKLLTAIAEKQGINTKELLEVKNAESKPSDKPK